jgi:ABC-type multidrug transport system ATPase subunit
MQPTAGLDPGERERFHNLLAEIGENVIVILSTHIVEDVSGLCSRMAIISHGVVEGFAIRLVRSVAGPELVRRGKRLIVRPRAAEGERTKIDVARLVEEERDRWPG